MTRRLLPAATLPEENTVTDTRVVLLGLDGFPHRKISPELTPHLWALGQQGGMAPDGGRSALPSSTYPGFATLLSGCLPARHRVLTTHTPGPLPSIVPGWAGEIRVQAPTLLDRCLDAGVPCAAIQGDHKLHAILATERVERVWPEGRTTLPPGIPLEPHGYPANQAVRPHLLAAAADSSLTFLWGHLNEADSWGHDYGPDAPQSHACYAETDRIIGELLDALAPDWERSVVIVVSDHDMEPRTATPPIDLLADPILRDFVDSAYSDGGCGLLHLRPGADPALVGARLLALPGVAGWHQAGPALLIAEAQPGHLFASQRLPRGGFHGGPATTRTVAVVGGGHPAVPAIAAAIQARPPHLADWAPTICVLLGLDANGMDGRNLAAGGANTR